VRSYIKHNVRHNKDMIKIHTWQASKRLNRMWGLHIETWCKYTHGHIRTYPGTKPERTYNTRSDKA
jgi:hypothetical protein